MWHIDQLQMLNILATDFQAFQRFSYTEKDQCVKFSVCQETGDREKLKQSLENPCANCDAG